ncbi:hypothetical protein AYI70_g5406 [Smittium culicis]|uniref:Uncharacterized protein n=1 Tax=Smittium culicis TaxID=133412 RepID=A0A1R1XUL2_9FUNG|nr:hypothetical protein AYI70_g5406 [Smittium culicis]
MTSETSSSTPDATVKQQEKSEASKDRITLRKKASLDQGTPQHILEPVKITQCYTVFLLDLIIHCGPLHLESYNR